MPYHCIRWVCFTYRCKKQDRNVRLTQSELWSNEKNIFLFWPPPSLIISALRLRWCAIHVYVVVPYCRSTTTVVPVLYVTVHTVVNCVTLRTFRRYGTLVLRFCVLICLSHVCAENYGTVVWRMFVRSVKVLTGGSTPVSSLAFSINYQYVMAAEPALPHPIQSHLFFCCPLASCDSSNGFIQLF